MSQSDRSGQCAIPLGLKNNGLVCDDNVLYYMPNDTPLMILPNYFLSED